jgi:hypothetical protein
LLENAIDEATEETDFSASAGSESGLTTGTEPESARGAVVLGVSG